MACARNNPFEFIPSLLGGIVGGVAYNALAKPIIRRASNALSRRENPLCTLPNPDTISIYGYRGGYRYLRTHVPKWPPKFFDALVKELYKPKTPRAWFMGGIEVVKAKAPKKQKCACVDLGPAGTYVLTESHKGEMCFPCGGKGFMTPEDIIRSAWWWAFRNTKEEIESRQRTLEEREGRRRNPARGQARPAFKLAWEAARRRAPWMTHQGFMSALRLATTPGGPVTLGSQHEVKFEQAWRSLGAWSAPEDNSVRVTFLDPSRRYDTSLMEWFDIPLDEISRLGNPCRKTNPGIAPFVFAVGNPPEGQLASPEERDRAGNVVRAAKQALLRHCNNHGCCAEMDVRAAFRFPSGFRFGRKCPTGLALEKELLAAQSAQRVLYGLKGNPPRKKKPSDKLRDMEIPMVLGHELDRETLTPKVQYVAPVTPGQDYGADPLGDGTFRMVPSGDIVDYAERMRRLARFDKDRGSGFRLNPRKKLPKQGKKGIYLTKEQTGSNRGGKYMVSCDTHGAYAQTNSLADAQSMPTFEFCDYCRGQICLDCSGTMDVPAGTTGGLCSICRDRPKRRANLGPVDDHDTRPTRGPRMDVKLPRHMVKGTITLREAIRRDIPGIRAAIKGFPKFHGTIDPDEEVIVIDDGRKDNVAGFLVGRAPEVVYDNVPNGSNKEGSVWVHKTSKENPTYLIHIPQTGHSMLLGGMRVSDWLRG